MGQNPVNPRPDLPPQPQSGPSGPSAPSVGQPVGPGHGYPGPQGPAQGPQGPQGPMPLSYGQPAPYGATPYGTQPGPGQPPSAPYGQPVPTPYGQPAPSPYGATPYGSPQGPGQPAPGQTYPYPGGPRGPYAAPGVPPLGRAPRKRGKGPIVAVVVGALVVLLAIGAGAYYLLVAKATPSSTEPDKATASTAALQGYLDALAAGDADKAKRYAMNPPADSPLLTNAFLKASVAKNPITEVKVDPSSDTGASTYLTASYKIGGTLVQGSFQLTKVNKIWKLNDVVSTVDRPTYWGTLGVTINGTTAPSPKLTFFPGVYQLATGTSLLAFDQTTFTVNEPSDYVSALSSSEPVLTDAGKKLMISQTQAWLTQCLAVQDTNPKDCGMNTPLPDGATLAPGSLKRTVDGSTAPFSDGSPQVSYDDPTKVTMSGYVSIKVTAADTAGKNYSGTTSVSSAVGTIAGENITVVFTD